MDGPKLTSNDVIAAHDALQVPSLTLEASGIGPVSMWMLYANCSTHGNLVTWVSTFGEMPEDTHLTCFLHEGVRFKVPITKVERLHPKEPNK